MQTMPTRQRAVKAPRLNPKTNNSSSNRAVAQRALAGRLISLLGRNARALTAAGLVAKLAALAVAVVLARGLGEREFGRYVVAVAFASLLGILVELGTGQTLVDLPYPRSATAAAAAAAGARVLDGLEVLVAQGAASFELWTGVPAPVPVMRRALGLPT